MMDVITLVTALLIGFSPSSSDSGARELTPGYLRCEYRVDPLGADETSPRLSWIVESDRRNQIQTAYRILVASSPGVLAEDRGDLWDTGRVESGETINVVYEGERLESRMRCYWKVQVWDAEGRPSPWSEPAFWSMGLLGESDWQADWIGYDRPREAEPEEETLDLTPARYVRTTFRSGKSVHRATAFVTALGLCDVYLNGARISEDYFNPGWTDYAKRVYYRTYDVTGMIRSGENTMGAVLADGWFSGYLGWRQDVRDHYGSRLRLRAQLHIEYTDGSEEVIASGPDWKAATGPLREVDLYMGEAYDARLEMEGWASPGFDDAGWESVDTGADVEPALQAHPGPPVRAVAEFTPVTITEPRRGAYVVDLGQIFSGVVRISVRGRPGQEITIRHAERLNPDGTIYTENLRGARATDYYICRGDGTETWSPRFTFHGFQYVELTGLSEPPTEETVTGIALTSDTPLAGTFECSEPMLNRLRQNIFWTQAANFIDIPTDCPQRDERLGWTGDAQVYVRAAAMNSDVQPFFTKWLVDLEDAQRADGQFPTVAPLKISGDDGGPAWADAGVICPWTIYEVYEDKRLLARHYDSMKRFIEFCKGRSTPDLLPPEDFHAFGDWLNIQADTPHEVIYTAYFAWSTKLTARAAEVLGRMSEAAEYNTLFEGIRSAFNRAYVQEDGRILGDTQTCYVLALAFDLVEGDRREQAAEHLVSRIRERDWHLSTGFVGTKDLMLVLSKIGATDVAYRLLHNDTFPSWGFTVKQGATSIWERWDGWTPENGFQDPGMNSFAHYSFGAVYQWMVENIGGIRTDGPGYRQIIIAPRPDGRITWARVGYNSIRGPIRSQWRTEGLTLNLDVTIPANTTARIVIPTVDPGQVTESGKAVGEAEGVEGVSVEAGRVIVTVGSGTYHFACTGWTRTGEIR